MTEGDDNSNAILARIRQELGKLPLSEHEIAQTASRLADSFLLRERSITNSTSTFFDFRRKIHAVPEHFAPASLTLEDYLRAAVKQPPLFYLSPNTIIANVEGVARHFHDHGLTISHYLRTAVKQPQLFYQSPKTIIANIEGVTRHFHDHGLTVEDYLRAAVRHPPLFARSPKTIIANIEGIARRFRDHGVTVKD
jgi:hypothetical protein